MNLNITQTKTILVCDDEAHIRHIVAAKLRETGFTVVEARDGVQGAELAKVHSPALIITDLQMPGGSGLEMAMALKGRPETASTPLLMLTARGYILDSAQIAKTNIVEVIAKPFGVRQLLERVKHVLGGGSSAQAA